MPNRPEPEEARPAARRMQHGGARPRCEPNAFLRLDRPARLLIAALRWARLDLANATSLQDGEASALLDAAGLDAAAAQRVLALVGLLSTARPHQPRLGCPGCQALSQAEQELARAMQALRCGRPREAAGTLANWLPARRIVPGLALFSLALGDLAD